MPKKRSVSSPQEDRIPASVLLTAPLTEKQRRSLKKLAVKPDAEINYSDAPEIIPAPADIEVGRFHRPR
jgi:hypothetical protein